MAASELTQRCWAIAEELGRPVPEEQKVYQSVCDEMLEVPIERHWALSIASYLSNWKKTKNPYFVDLAFMLLANLGGQPTETMMREDIAARTLRFYGSPAGTSDSILNESAEWAALILMANLIFSGATLRDSSLKAASYYAIRHPQLKRKKASTLERFYSQKIRRTGVETEFFERWEKGSSPELRQQWQEIFAAIPACPEDLIGNARD